jgi:broad specificity phosphatase PhoE
VSDSNTKILETLKWAKNARQLLNHAAKLIPDLPAYLFIRHSHRLDPADRSQMWKEPITEFGSNIAQEFGRRLASISSRNILLYHSPLLRCQQTAMKILEGIKSVNGKGSLIGPKSELLDLEGKQTEIDKIEQSDKFNYVNYWVLGFYRPEIIEPACHYGLRMVKMLQQLNITDPNTLVLMVGHDDRLLGFRAVCTGICVDSDWLPFLGGYIFQFTTQSIQIYHRNQHGIQIPYPYWWPR